MVNQYPELVAEMLKFLQARFCIIKLDGQLRVGDRDQIAAAIRGDDPGGVAFYKRSDGVILMRRHLATVTLTTMTLEDEEASAIGAFWIAPTTHVFDRIAFTPEFTSANVINYWVPPVESVAVGDWTPIYNFLRDVICDGSSHVVVYLIRFMAHMLQMANEKPGIIIVLLGAQGTGKGVFFSLLRAIWKRTTLQVSDVNHVIGNFNAILERHYIVCMDEALFVGDRKSIERLKSLITEPVIRTEEKNQPARTIASLHRFFAASNSDHFTHVDRDDRRFVFLRVSSVHQQDDRYFARLVAAINDANTVGAMVRDLLQIDLTGFNVHRRPRTREHVEQKIQSLSGLERYWFELLQAGEVPNSGLTAVQPWSVSIFVRTKDLMAGYREFDKQADRFKPVQANSVGKALAKLCPTAKPKRECDAHGGQARGYRFPRLATARVEFEEAIRSSIDWTGAGDDGSQDLLLEALWEAYELSAADEIIDTADLQQYRQLEALREVYDLSESGEWIDRATAQSPSAAARQCTANA